MSVFPQPSISIHTLILTTQEFLTFHGGERPDIGNTMAVSDSVSNLYANYGEFSDCKSTSFLLIHRDY